MDTMTVTKIAILSLFVLSLYLFLRARQERREAKRLRQQVGRYNLSSVTVPPESFRISHSPLLHQVRVEAVHLDAFGGETTRTIKLFPYAKNDVEGYDFAVREAEELIDKLTED